MEKVFETKVVKVGDEASGMISDANMIVLFGEGAPEELADYCYTIDSKDLKGKITVGGKVAVDAQEFEILAVGDVVEKNLSNLGHFTIAFNADPADILPGAMLIDAKSVEIGEGSVIQIFS